MAEAAAPALLGPILKKGGTKLFEVITYVWDYQTSIASLKSHRESLQSRLSDVQREVDNARSHCRDIKLQVEKWLQDVNSKVKASDDFLDSVRSPVSCWRITSDCNCKRRYNMAMKAETLSKEIKTLLEECRFGFGFGGVSFEPKPLCLAPMLAAGYVATASRAKYLERLRDLLSLGSSGEKLVIGVYGAEGAGKTMLVKKLAAEIESSGQFNGVVLTSGAQTTMEIQQEIAERIGLSLTLRSPQERARWLYDRLANIGQVVFVIDSVEKMIDLNEIGVPWPDSNNGCRIVVVSRRASVCKLMKTQMNLEVEPLSQDESLDLFDELAKEYDFAGTSACGFQEARDHISSKPAWLPAQIRAYIHEFHSNPMLSTNSMIASDRSGSKTVLLVADTLQIKHADETKYWRWSTDPSTSRLELISNIVWVLRVVGKARKEWLLPATYYGAYFVYKLLPSAQGFKTNQVKLTVASSDKNCYLDPSMAASLHVQNLIGDRDMPKAREDEWLEIEMGSFYNNDGSSNPEVFLRVEHKDSSVRKSGICIQGIELRQLE